MTRIENRKDHAAALKRLEELMLAYPAQGSRDDRKLDSLATLIERYERETIFIPKPSASEILQFRMEQAQ